MLLAHELFTRGKTARVLHHTGVILSVFAYERLKRRLRNPLFSVGGAGSFTLSSG
jgi:hypothetical protein